MSDEITRAEQKARATLNGWVDALIPKFNAIEMQSLRQRLTAAFREYETEVNQLRELLGKAEEVLRLDHCCYSRLCAQHERIKHALALIEDWKGKG